MYSSSSSWISSASRFIAASKGIVLSAYTPTIGGVAEAIIKMSMGNGFGFKFNDALTMKQIFEYSYGGFVMEVTEDIPGAVVIGEVTEEDYYSYSNCNISVNDILGIYEDKLEKVIRQFYIKKDDNILKQTNDYDTIKTIQKKKY